MGAGAAGDAQVTCAPNPLTSGLAGSQWLAVQCVHTTPKLVISSLRFPHKRTADPPTLVLRARRELWYRGSLAWQSLLQPQPATASEAGSSSSGSSSSSSNGGGGAAGGAPARQLLVVAHNAINQGLVATALGLPPQYFRCVLVCACGRVRV